MTNRSIFTADSMAAMRTDVPPWAVHIAAPHVVSVVTSIPDASETGQSAAAWRTWFVEAVALSARVVSEAGLFVAMQSDVRIDGWWTDKSALVAQGVVDSDTGLRLLARKVLCRKPPGTASTSRAAFTHALLYGRQPMTVVDVIADVLPNAGLSTWKRGIGAEATWQLLGFVQRHAPACDTIFDPFCGEGLMLAQAQRRGLHAVGVERHHKRAQSAQRMVVGDDGMVPRSSTAEHTPSDEGIDDADQFGGLDR
jgi:hypothetical protein